MVCEMGTEPSKELSPGQPGACTREHLHFLGYAACQFKPVFKDIVDVVVERYARETGLTLNCHIPLGCAHDDDYDGIWMVDDIHDFPDVVASMGFGDFFRKEFVERFVKKGYFRTAWKASINEPFEKAGFRDPDGWYTIYSVFPYVMLVDQRKLDGRPVPRQWSDLLDQRFRESIIMNGADGSVSEVPLLYFFKEHGEEGLIRLAANFREAWHPAQMAKAAASKNSRGTPVYVMPWFFAQARCPSDGIEVVWPEDGALTSPVYLLVKESKFTELAPLVECITGADLGAMSARACFPSLNPEVDNRLPEHASFKWIGWDYIKSNDIEELRTHTSDVFFTAWRNNRKE
jgi:ABC-type Fe3+ transport system substrate-binding protein